MFVSGKLPVSKIRTHRPKIRIFAPHGRIVAQIHVKLDSKKARKTKHFIYIPDPIHRNLAGKGVENFHLLRGQIQLNWICDFGAPMVRFAMQILR